MVYNNYGYAALDVHGDDKPLVPYQYTVRSPLDDEVIMEVYYAGICHSDIHTVKAEWGTPDYPIVPGHEIVGIVVEVGKEVKSFRIGDRIGVGCMVGSCEKCKYCNMDVEQYCKECAFTYNSNLRGQKTYGGYSKYVLVSERMGIHIPQSVPLEKAAPLLCAGITTYSPLVKYNAHKGGMKVGVLGLGGLGHMAVQLAKVMGNEVYVFSRTEGKRELAMELGATDLILSGDQEKLSQHAKTFDLIIDTISADKDISMYMNLIAPLGKLVIVAAPEHGVQYKVRPSDLIMKSCALAGSVIGGVKQTQEMIEFCAEKEVYPLIEMIPVTAVNEAYNRVLKSDVKFRFVMDIKNTLQMPEGDKTEA